MVSAATRRALHGLQQRRWQMLVCGYGTVGKYCVSAGSKCRRRSTSGCPVSSTGRAWCIFDDRKPGKVHSDRTAPSAAAACERACPNIAMIACRRASRIQSEFGGGAGASCINRRRVETPDPGRDVGIFVMVQAEWPVIAFAWAARAGGEHDGRRARGGISGPLRASCQDLSRCHGGRDAICFCASSNARIDGGSGLSGAFERV
ncbi:hypothetical protein C8Q80DRAFT_1173271 [Daedaleopsis nitida]|nr:hypothetical protein C8Q80DRAFT_1173271 [Daedaleopsis nitida]